MSEYRQCDWTRRYLVETGRAHAVLLKFIKSAGSRPSYDFTGATQEDRRLLSTIIKEVTTFRYLRSDGENKRQAIRSTVKFFKP